MNTIPEQPETLAAQVRWLEQGKRRAVLVPTGTPLPQLANWLGLAALPTAIGLFLYRTTECTPDQIFEAIHDDTVGALLGYGIAAKPAPGEEVGAVTIRDAQGTVKQGVVTDAARLGHVVQAACAMADPDDEVRVEDVNQVLKERLPALRRELHLHPLRTPAQAKELTTLALKHGHDTLLPTHVIQRDGKIIGYVAINSLPLYRIWMKCDDVPAKDTFELARCIENHYRMAGVDLIASLIDVDCNCYPLAARLGYLELPDERVHLKRL